MRYRNDPMVRMYEFLQNWLQERGRPFLIAVGIIVGIAVLYIAGSAFFSWRSTRAAKAFADAYEIYAAPVQATAPIGSTTKFYTDEQTKWRETAQAFERLANDYPGYYDAIGRYYAGVAYLKFERDKGVQMLEQVAGKNDSEASDLARMALAESYFSGGDTAKAIGIYEQLLTSTSSLKQVAQLRLGNLYEKSGETEKAVAAYFEVAQADRTSAAGSEAEKRLSAIAPQKIKELPEAAPKIIP